jgi:hypothetical protein
MHYSGLLPALEAGEMAQEMPMKSATGKFCMWPIVLQKSPRNPLWNWILK